MRDRVEDAEPPTTEPDTRVGTIEEWMGPKAVAKRDRHVAAAQSELDRVESVQETFDEISELTPEQFAAALRALRAKELRGDVQVGGVPPLPLPPVLEGGRKPTKARLESLEHFALGQMKSRAQYNAMVKREADAGRDVSDFPTYKLEPNRATRRRIQALRKRHSK